MPTGCRWLHNGNLPGDPKNAPRCGAKTRAGTPCQQPAMRGKRRCRLHGGKSTGPRTPEGLERARKAPITHGRETAERRASRRAARARLKDLLRRSRELDGYPLRDPEVADVVECLLVEARRSDEDGGSSRARIAALVAIGEHLGMFPGRVR